MSDPYPLFPAFAFIGFVVALIPLPWHLQALNAGTCIYMFWASMSSLIQFVDSIVWHGTTDNIAPVWCDISTKFLIGAGVGIPAASLCINRRLYKIACIQTVRVTHAEKRRAIFVDLGIAIGLPILVMILHIVVQGHRFNILEDVGCIPTIYNTPPAYPLVFMWPVLIGCVSFCYAFLTLRSFWRRRVEFASILSSSTSLTTSRYFRLMLLSCTEMACTVPLGAYSIYANVGGVPIARWTNWADVHFNFGFVQQIPAVIWKQDHRFLVAVEMGRWIYPCSAMLFFALFGFADEAQRNYSRAFWFVAGLFGIKPQHKQMSKASGFVCSPPPRFGSSDDAESLPAYSPPPTGLCSSPFLRDKDVEKTAESPASNMTTFMVESRSPNIENTSFPTTRRISEPVMICLLPSSPSSSSGPSTSDLNSSFPAPCLSTSRFSDASLDTLHSEPHHLP